MAQRVRWRTTGHQLRSDTTVDMLRFEVADLNQVIKTAGRASDLYDDLRASGGLGPADQVLPLSCFAITDVWTKEALAAGTHYTSCYVTEARILLAAGFPLWPTEVFDDDVPDPRNEVHYDLLVAYGPNLPLAELAGGTKSELSAARAALTPRFLRLLEVLGTPEPVRR